MRNDIDKRLADMFVFVDEMHCQVQGECGWVKDEGRGFGVNVDCILHYMLVIIPEMGRTGIGSYDGCVIGFGIARFDQALEHDFC
jgi:hypothetical protein